jgi:hypothetical protein
MIGFYDNKQQLIDEIESNVTAILNEEPGQKSNNILPVLITVLVRNKNKTLEERKITIYIHADGSADYGSKKVCNYEPETESLPKDDQLKSYMDGLAIDLDLDKWIFVDMLSAAPFNVAVVRLVKNGANVNLDGTPRPEDDQPAIGLWESANGEIKQIEVEY